MADVETVATEDAPSSERPWWRPPIAGLPLVLTAVLALVPALRIAWMIRRAPRLPYGDYWPMLDSAVGTGGSLDLGGLFELRNEHPVVVAKLAFWVNAHLFDGSNRSLAVAVILVGVAQVVVIAAAACRTGRPTPWMWATLVVAGAALVFSAQGLWHFHKSMSGMAWLPANLFVLLALTLHHCRRTGGAVVSGVLAMFSYGTGLLVWPVLIVATVLRDRSLRRAWPYGVATIAALAWYLPAYAASQEGASEGQGTSSARVVLDNVGGLLGAFFTGEADDLSRRLGVTLLLFGLGIGLVAALRRLRGGPERGEAIWGGLLVYAIGSAGMTSGARVGFFFDLTASRYAAIGALFVLAVLGSLASMLDDRPGWRNLVTPILAAVCVVAVSLSGQDRQAERDRGLALQDQLATAMQLDLASGSTIWMGGLGEMPSGIEDKLRSMDHVPFDGTYDLDCGLLGTTVDPAPPSSPPVGEVVETASYPDLEQVEVIGWVDPGRPVDCVVLLDPEGVVVGAAGAGPAEEGYSRSRPDRPEHPTWFFGMARTDGEVATYVRFEGDDALHLVAPADATG